MCLAGGTKRWLSLTGSRLEALPQVEGSVLGNWYFTDVFTFRHRLGSLGQPHQKSLFVSRILRGSRFKDFPGALTWIGNFRILEQPERSRMRWYSARRFSALSLRAMPEIQKSNRFQSLRLRGCVKNRGRGLAWSCRSCPFHSLKFVDRVIEPIDFKHLATVSVRFGNN